MTMTIDRQLRFNHGVMENLLDISRQYLDQGKAEDALRVLQPFAEAGPASPELLGLRKEAIEAALDSNLKLLKNPGHNEELLESRGDLYAEAGMDDEAMAAWQQALKALQSLAEEGSPYPLGMDERLREKIRVLGGILGD